jgi:glycosyltransferase involved in cell wall biosynthesis
MKSALDTRLRILAIASRAPWPLNGGGKIRLYHFLRLLAERHSVTLITTRRDSLPETLPPDVTWLPARATVKSTKIPAPRTTQRYFGRDDSVARWLMQPGLRNRFDVAFISGATNGVYADVLPMPAIWDLCDELVLAHWRAAKVEPLRTLVAHARAAWMGAWHERDTTRRVARTLVASAVDAAWLRPWAGSPVRSLSSGVDVAYFAPQQPPASTPTVVFVGALTFPPNVDALHWFADNVWGKVQGQHPDARFMIVGRGPADQVRGLAQRPGVTLHVDVADVRPFLDQARVVVVPTRMGGGVKTKVIEACAAGRPVIVSFEALGDFTAIPGTEVCVATRTDEWVSTLAELFVDDAQVRRIASAGLAWARRNHDWSTIGNTLNRLFADIAISVRPQQRAASSAATTCGTRT